MSSLLPDNLISALAGFKSVIFQGTYPASFPIHFALDYAAAAASHGHNLDFDQLSSEKTQNKKVLFLSAVSRQHLQRTLKAYNDTWLAHHSGLGRIASAVSSRIEIHYPPSVAHLVLLLAALQYPQAAATTDADSGSGNGVVRPLGSLPSGAEQKMVLDDVPGLIVLYEPSAYLFPGQDGDGDHGEDTSINEERKRNASDSPSRLRAPGSSTTDTSVSSYLSILARMLATVSQLGVQTKRPAVVVFDSKLRDLQLPVISPSRLAMSRQVHVDEEEGEGTDDSDEVEVKAPRKEAVAPLAHQYFQWVGDFEHIGDDAEVHTGVLRLHHASNGTVIVGDDHRDNSMSWKYAERTRAAGTTLTWK